MDNSPILGRYLVDPGSLSPDVLDTAGVTRKFSYKQATSAYTPSTNNFFDVGDRIPAAISTGGGVLRSGYGGYWGLRLAGPDGACATDGPGNYLQFRVDVPPQQCALHRTLNAQTCEALSSDRLLTNLRIGTSPVSNPSSVSGSSFVPVTVGVVTVANAATGLLTAGTNTSLVSAWDATTCTCSGAVVGVDYRVTYSHASLQVIQSVVADVVVSSITQALGVCGSEPVDTPLTAAATFLADSTPTTSYADSSASRYQRSGMPGYIQGSPVLAGVLVAQPGGDPSAPASTDKLAIQRSAPEGLDSQFADLDNGVGFSLANLHLRGPAVDGSCVAYSALAAAGADRALPLAVLFGEDMTASCALKLDVTQLQALCVASSTVQSYIGLGVINASLLSGGEYAAPTHVGMLGNSDPWKVWQWSAVQKGSAPGAASWDSVHQTCTGITTGIDVEFLVAAIGAASNPQYKIVASRTRYATDNWAYSREDVRTSSPALPQTFMLRSTVTFTEYTVDDTTVFAAAPPVIPKIPSDLWYPFQTADDTAALPFISSSAVSIKASLAAVAVAVMAAVMLSM